MQKTMQKTKDLANGWSHDTGQYVSQRVIERAAKRIGVEISSVYTSGSVGGRPANAISDQDVARVKEEVIGNLPMSIRSGQAMLSHIASFGISQTEIARQSGISQSRLSQIKNGKTCIRLFEYKILKQLAEELKGDQDV